MMNQQYQPTVSVVMIAYNVAPYIGAAIEGVIAQETNFPVELVIGEDCSKDDTRAIAERYAEQFPDRIRLLPSDHNRGIAGNAAKVIRACRGKYLAVCDSDDIWIDPHKLQRQVDFLEEHPDYGAIYTDVKIINEHGEDWGNETHDHIRRKYRGGKVFFELLQRNFINNSTALFRKALIQDHHIDEDRSYFTHDHLIYLHIATTHQIYFWDAPSTAYRKHSGGVTNSREKLRNNRLKFQQQLYSVLERFDRRYPYPISAEERTLIFKKLLSVLYRRANDAKAKLGALRLLIKYFPGLSGLRRIAQKTPLQSKPLEKTDKSLV